MKKSRKNHEKIMKKSTKNHQKSGKNHVNSIKIIEN